MMELIKRLGTSLKTLLEARAALNGEISAASQHEDYGMLATLHMEEQRMIQAITTTRRELGDAVIAWMDGQS